MPCSTIGINEKLALVVFTRISAAESRFSESNTPRGFAKRACHRFESPLFFFFFFFSLFFSSSRGESRCKTVYSLIFFRFSSFVIRLFAKALQYVTLWQKINSLVDVREHFRIVSFCLLFFFFYLCSLFDTFDEA